MSRNIDWTELEEGAVFDVPNPGGSWGDRLGIWQPTGTLYTLKQGKIFNLANLSSPLTLHSANPNYRWKGYSVRQQVRVYDQAEVPQDRYIMSVSQHINSCTGSDPEIFVVRGKVRKSLLPAFKYLPKQEEQQKKYSHIKPAFGTIDSRLTAYSYRDGFAAECYIHPVHCHGYLINYLRDGLNSVIKAARAFDRTAQLTVKNTFTIPAITMNSAADEDIALGCMPSLNAYGDNPELPVAARDFRLRFAGGHVHFGIAPLNDEDAAEMVRACDVIAAIPAVAMFASLDTPVRRQFYGRAGEYRKPKHGLEYRVLSNAWLAAPEVAHLVLNLVRSGLKVGKAGYRSYLDIDEQAARDIVNFCDVKAAREYVTKHMSMFYTLLANDGVTRDANSERAFKMIVEGGIEAVLPNFEDVERNWVLEGPWSGESNEMSATWRALCRRLPTK